MNPAVDNRHKQIALAAILLLGLLIRLPTIATGFHAAHDINVYIHWGGLVQTQGLSNVYAGPEVVYPPLLIYLFGGAVWLEAHLGLPTPTDPDAHRLAALIIQVPTALADVLTAGLLAWVVWRRAPGVGLLAAGVYLVNPAIWYVTAFWGQTDSVYTVLLLAALMALARRAVLPAWLLYALALACKFQSIALAPLLIAWTLAKHGVRGLVGGLAVLIGVETVMYAPWLLAGRGDDLIRLGTVALEKRVVLTAYNFWYVFLGENVRARSDAYPTPLPLTYQDWGNLLFAGLAIGIVGLALWRGSDLAVPAAALSLGMFLVLTEMHERHAFPALAFLTWAGAEELARRRPANAPAGVTGWGRSRAIVGMYGVLTLTVLFNLITIVPFSPLLGTSLAADEPASPRWVLLKSLSFVVALLNIGLLFGLIGYIGQARGRALRPILASDSPVP